MTRRAATALLAALIVALGTVAWAAEEESRIVNGPSRTSFGGLELVLGQGASAETAFQPDASKLVVKTIIGEARIVTSARNLVLVENSQGRVEILLPNGRLIVVGPERAEIVGRTLGDDPGSITIRLSGTGPIAQAGAGDSGFVQSVAQITILSTGQPSLLDSPLSNDPSGRGPTPLSPSQ